MGQRGRNFEMRRAVSPVVERQTMPAHSPVLAAVTAEDATEAGVSVGVDIESIMSAATWRYEMADSASLQTAPIIATASSG